MSLTLKLFITLALASVCWAQCNTCGHFSNIACINATHYNLCDVNNALPTGIISKCPDGYYCTTAGFKCTTTASMAACPNNVAVSGCGCSAGSIDPIACTSRTQFVICEDGVATTQTGTCPDGYVCNMDPAQKKICVSETCFMPTCDREPVVRA